MNNTAGSEPSVFARLCGDTPPVSAALASRLACPRTFLVGFYVEIFSTLACIDSLCMRVCVKC